jgi:broad specificity phosphatase PhoE
MSESGRIFLVRHGRTVLNRDVRFRGTRDVPLDEVGQREAWTVARSLSDVGLTAVFTSPLARARHVAEAIANLAGLRHVVIDPLLTNLDYGEWEGLTKEEAFARDPDPFWLYANQPERATCPGGESLATAADRIMEALHRITVSNQGRPVAIVTHGVMVRLAVLRIAGPRSAGQDWQFKLPTGSATVIGTQGDQLRLLETSDRTEPDPRKGATVLTADHQDADAPRERRRHPDRRQHDLGWMLAINQRRGPRRAAEKATPSTAA